MRRGRYLFLDVRAVLEDAFGLQRAEIPLAAPWTLLVYPRLVELDRLFSSEDATNAGRTIELVGKRKDGLEFPLELSLVTWRSDDGALYTCIVRDISDRKRIASELEELLSRVEAIARTDELTGMANRRAWDARLADALRERAGFTVAMLDLEALTRRGSRS